MSEISTKHNGDLIIADTQDAKKYAHIMEVSGYLYIRADAQLPVLTSVGGSLDIRADEIGRASCRERV